MVRPDSICFWNLDIFRIRKKKKKTLSSITSAFMDASLWERLCMCVFLDFEMCEVRE